MLNPEKVERYLKRTLLLDRCENLINYQFKNSKIGTELRSLQFKMVDLQEKNGDLMYIDRDIYTETEDYYNVNILCSYSFNFQMELNRDESNIPYREDFLNFRVGVVIDREFLNKNGNHKTPHFLDIFSAAPSHESKGSLAGLLIAAQIIRVEYGNREFMNLDLFKDWLEEFILLKS